MEFHGLALWYFATWLAQQRATAGFTLSVLVGLCITTYERIAEFGMHKQTDLV